MQKTDKNVCVCVGGGHFLHRCKTNTHKTYTYTYKHIDTLRCTGTPSLFDFFLTLPPSLSPFLFFISPSSSPGQTYQPVLVLFFFPPDDNTWNDPHRYRGNEAETETEEEDGVMGSEQETRCEEELEEDKRKSELPPPRQCCRRVCAFLEVPPN